ASKQRQKLLVDRHVAPAVGGFRREMFRWLNTNNASSPTEGLPLQLVDLVAPQTGHRRQEEDLQLLLRQFANSVLNQRLKVQRATVSHGFPLVERHAVKRQFLRLVHRNMGQQFSRKKAL